MDGAVPQPDAPERNAAETALSQQMVMLRGYLRHLVGPDHAEDLAQEVCLEALKNPQILFRGADRGAYLRGIARHLASRHHRRIKRELVIEEMIDLAWEASRVGRASLPATGEGDAGAEARSTSEQQALKACLEQMPEKTRSMIVWRYDEGQNAAQIAVRMKMSGDAIRMALARARQALSKCIRQRMAAGGAA
jgi:RNA polymerase sigma-70 factor (ECF subfamily)